MAEEEQDKVINHCPECNEAIDVTEQMPHAKILCPHCDKAVRVRTILGNFQIDRMLGEGGMSQVFLAEDMTLKRRVALKVLHHDLSQDKALMALFEREAQLTASINHPNVVKVYTAGSEGGYFYIAMELVDKISLEELIAERGALAEGEVLDIAHDVASGLRAAFHGGLIHRDIKPGNILLTKAGSAKLVDFGLAVAHGDDDHVEDLWATPFYVPPEKLEGEPDDFRGDIYSLGATFFHTLAGHPPFEANTASLEELREIKSKPVTLHEFAPQVSVMTGKLIDRMMAYQPEDRPSSYEDLIEQIETEQDRQPDSAASRAKRKRVLASAKSASGDTNWMKFLGIGVGVLAIAGIAIALLNGGGNNGEDELLIGNEERVLTAGEKNLAARYKEARTMLVEGRYPDAEKGFSALLDSPDIKQPTLSLTLFNSGLAHLLMGDEKEGARKRFANLAEASGFDRSSERSSSQAAFFEKSGTILSGPLPVLSESEGSLDRQSFESLALLAFGLKNWNHGQFDSAVAFFKEFETANPTDEWVRNYQSIVGPFQTDYAAFQKLPNPRLAMSEDELAAARTALEAAGGEFKTTGALPDLVRIRLRRIDSLLDAKKALAATSPPEVDPVTRPDPAMNNPSGTEGLPPEVQAEKARLGESLLSYKDLARNYQFTDIMTALDGLTFETPLVQQLHEDSKAACRGAEEFMARLVSHLSSGSFEGVVRRKEGLPLEATIPSASHDQIVVDLGFGPNDLAMEKLAPDWLLEVARKLWLNTSASPPSSTPVPWAEAAWFSGMTEQKNEAGEFSSEILGKDADFTQRWERLKTL